MRQVHYFVLDDLCSRQDAIASNGTLPSDNAEAQFFKPFSIGDIFGYVTMLRWVNTRTFFLLFLKLILLLDIFLKSKFELTICS
jgi:hypothetical protein